MSRCIAWTTVLAFVLAGVVSAAEGVVVSYAKEKLVVKIGEQERTFDLPKKVHVHKPDGSEVKYKERAKFLKRGTTIALEEEGGKVEEINIKK